MSRAIPFRREFDFLYGRMERVAPMLRRIVARNPSPFTWYGAGNLLRPFRSYSLRVATTF